MNNSKINKSLPTVIVTVVILAIIIGFSIFTNLNNNSHINNEQADGTVTVHFIDVGQGDCILIKTSTSVVLIDAGENEYATDVLSYLKKLNITKLDYIIATHPHSDHIGSMDEVIKGFEIGKIIMPKLADNIVPTTKCYRDLLEAISAKSMKITAAVAGNTIDLGEAKLEILSPLKQYDDLNESSVACRLTHQNINFLFMGDCGKTAEKDIIDSGATLSATVLKAGHHGSKNSSCEEFLEKVSPEASVIMCGTGNSYGHPQAKALERLKAVNSEIFRTDLNGTIVFTSDGNSISYKTSR